MSEASLELEDALTAIVLALFSFRNYNHPPVFLLLESAFFEETDRRTISGIRGCRQLLQPHVPCNFDEAGYYFRPIALQPIFREEHKTDFRVVPLFRKTALADLFAGFLNPDNVLMIC